ncbi:uncharacterized protein LOC106866531 [Brachypodium distachyon]|uniref:Uncharacterized protein n=1 Tax=Brachypodium distachyon TaxID=15368 RepID=A0A2K2D4A7_BRADI|nr:uncharacterized protein LOC106866531 [Brachypodium distachyon]PNT69124.1 hypothetical protein BRADI_3g49915v3 [Brachypodium distachyon]|eukprot:XP_014756453.1 uncharacterized protein LOC106866531 [Brachypodium distachyon]
MPPSSSGRLHRARRRACPCLSTTPTPPPSPRRQRASSSRAPGASPCSWPPLPVARNHRAPLLHPLLLRRCCLPARQAPLRRAAQLPWPRLRDLLPELAAAVPSAASASARPLAPLGPSPSPGSRPVPLLCPFLFFLKIGYLTCGPHCFCIVHVCCCSLVVAPRRAALLLHFVDAREDHIALKTKPYNYFAHEDYIVYDDYVYDYLVYVGYFVYIATSRRVQVFGSYVVDDYVCVLLPGFLLNSGQFSTPEVPAEQVSR